MCAVLALIEQFNTKKTAAQGDLHRIRMAVMPLISMIIETHETCMSNASKLDSLRSETKRIAQKVDLSIYEASGQNPVYKTWPVNGYSVIRQAMVEMVISMFSKGCKLSVRSACEKVLKKFAGTPGAYTSLCSFSRQVYRRLGDSATI